jgi:hypothetical protein
MSPQVPAGLVHLISLGFGLITATPTAKMILTLKQIAKGAAGWGSMD